MGRNPARRLPVKPSKPGKVRPRRVLPLRRVPLVRPEPPCPWSEGDLSRIVEEACRFIEGVKERIGADLGREVGDYLFFDVYGGDEAYIRRNDRTKQDSIRDIAKGCGVPAVTLRGWLEVAIVRHKLERAGVDPELGNRHLRALYPLVDDIDSMAALAGWAMENEASASELGARVQKLVGRKVTRPRRVGRARSHPSPDDLLVPRLLGVVDRWLERADLTAREAGELRALVLAIRDLVKG